MAQNDKPADDGSKLEKPRSQVVAERLSKEDKEPSDLFVSQSPAESPIYSDGFVGVSPEYQNYANDFDRPLAAKSGVEKAAEKKFEESLKDEASEPGEKLKSVYGDVDRGYGSGVREGESSNESDGTPDDEDVQFPGEDDKGKAKA